jgi:hypothetical protein
MKTPIVRGLFVSFLASVLVSGCVATDASLAGNADDATSSAVANSLSEGAARTPIFVIVMENHNWSSIAGNRSQARNALSAFAR